MNLTLELTTEQVIDFLQQMPPKEKIDSTQGTCKGSTRWPRRTDEIRRIKSSRIMRRTRIGLGRDDRR